jgi:hypothetical protein
MMARSRSGITAAVAAIVLVSGVPVAVAWTNHSTARTAADPQPAAGPAVQPQRSLPQPGIPPPSPTRPPLSFTFKTAPYRIHTAPRADFPYAQRGPIALVEKGIHDASGVRMVRIGGRLRDHPVNQARYGIDNLESYVVSHDRRYLNRAKAQAGRLMRRANKAGGAWYLPYPFEFKLHNEPTDRMVPPWYSAMAQGYGVTLFVRLYEVTKDEKYRTAADRVFASFLRPRATAKPWTVWVDASDHLWLEEYPGRSPDRTLNGHLFAIFGLWDYWRLTSDERAKTLFRGALTTVRDYLPRLRAKKWISQYCLTHPAVHAEGYHLIHIRLLRRLFTLSHDITFLRDAETFNADYPPPGVSGVVRFAAGAHQGVKFTAKGAVRSRKTVRLGKAASARTDQRIRIQGQPGLWYRITAGPFDGYFVREKYAVVALKGQSVEYTNSPGRPATMTAHKTYTGLTFADDGTVVSRQKVAPAEDTSFDAVAVGWWNGREYLLAGTGPLTGRWIHRATLSD